MIEKNNSSNEQLIGSVVESKSGRDKGRVMIVVGVCDENHVLVADGTLRKLINPKKKKLKHLIFKDVVVENIKTKLLEKKQVFDAELRKCVLTFSDCCEIIVDSEEE